MEFTPGGEHKQRAADTPAGGGRADTPAGGGQAGETPRMGVYACATGMGKGGHGGSLNPNARVALTPQG